MGCAKICRERKTIIVYGFAVAIADYKKMYLRAASSIILLPNACVVYGQSVICVTQSHTSHGNA